MTHECMYFVHAVRFIRDQGPAIRDKKLRLVEILQN